MKTENIPKSPLKIYPPSTIIVQDEKIQTNGTSTQNPNHFNLTTKLKKDLTPKDLEQLFR